MEYHKRKNIRLPGYDYRQTGGYFVTICTEERRCILSSVKMGNKFVHADVRLSELGTIVETAIKETEVRTGIKVHDFVIMPNHIHLMLLISRRNEAYSVGSFVGMLKSLALYRWRMLCSQRGVRTGKVWQRNYFEHIIRNEQDYQEKLRYIAENPDAWCEDELHKE